MSTAAIENPLPVNGGESKSARKKKAKAAEAANSNGNSNGTAQAPPTATPQAPAKEESSNGADASGSFEHPHLKELQKQIRNVNKRLAGLQKTDAVQEANPGVSLDDLVAQRKINNDQRAASAKKPQLLEQLASLEEQVTTFRTVDGEYQAQMAKQKESLTEQHRKELDAAKEEHTREAGETGKGELREKLLIFSQFLRAAAAKRNEVDDAGTDESAAFEGALLLVYGGDQTAVKTAVNIIEGSDEQVPSIEGLPLPFKCTSPIPSHQNMWSVMHCKRYTSHTNETIQTPKSNNPPSTTPPSSPKKPGPRTSPTPTPQSAKRTRLKLKRPTAQPPTPQSPTPPSPSWRSRPTASRPRDPARTTPSRPLSRPVQAMKQAT